MRKPFWTWKNTAGRLGRVVSRILNGSKDSKSRDELRLEVENLEQRQMLSSVSGFEGQVLTSSVSFQDDSIGSAYVLHVSKGDNSAPIIFDNLQTTPSGSGLQIDATDIELQYVDDGQFVISYDLYNEGQLVGSQSGNADISNVVPEIELSASVESVTPGMPFQVSFKSLDPGQDSISQWEVDWGDGVVEQFAGSLSEATHVYQAIGEYEVTVTATDEDGVYSPVPLTLDSTFGDRGYVSVDFDGRDDTVNEVLIQKDGKPIVVGTTFHPSKFQNFGLVRYNTDGTLDTTFGVGGKVSTNIVPNSNSNDRVGGVTLQEDGKILVSGATIVSGQGNNVAIARYNTDGSLDTTFGNGGVFNFDVSTVAGTTGTSDDYGFELEVVDDQIILVGRSKHYLSNPSTWDLLVVKLDQNGQNFDATFGTDGVVTTDIALDRDYGYSVGVQSDGKILVGGYAAEGSALGGWNMVVARYLPDGTLDTTFGPNGGYVTYSTSGSQESLFDVLVKEDDSFYVAGYGNHGISSFDFLLVSFTAEGQVDSSYGPNGTGSTRASWGGRDLGLAATLQDDGRVVMAGRYRSNASGDPIVEHFGVARFNPDGSMDDSFGDGGRATVLIEGSYESAHSVKVDPEGNLFVAGSVTGNEGTDGHDFGLAKFLPSKRVSVQGSVARFDSQTGQLDIVGSELADSIQVETSSSGYILLNGQNTGVLAEAVQGFRVDGFAGHDNIDLSRLVLSIGVMAVVDAGSGNDVVLGSEGSDSLLGGDGDDEIRGNGGRDYVWGEQGNDSLVGGQGDDQIEGGDGNDLIAGNSGNDLILGGRGDDEISGGSGNDTIFGDAGIGQGSQGSDIIRGEDGDDQLYGEDDDDLIYGGAGTDQVFDGIDQDLVYLADTNLPTFVVTNSAVVANAPVSFDYSDLDAQVLARQATGVRISFGDGQAVSLDGAGRIADHRYDGPGEYLVEFTAYDDFGVLAQSQKTIVVVEFDLLVSTLDDVVDDNYEEGELSLREAILLANDRSGKDKIGFSESILGTELTTLNVDSDLYINSEIEIQGPGRQRLAISGGRVYGAIFDVDGSEQAASLDISEFSIVDPVGTGIHAFDATVQAHGVSIEGAGEFGVRSIDSDLTFNGFRIVNSGMAGLYAGVAEGEAATVQIIDGSFFENRNGVVLQNSAGTDLEFQFAETYMRSGSLLINGMEIESRLGVEFSDCEPTTAMTGSGGSVGQVCAPTDGGGTDGTDPGGDVDGNVGGDVEGGDPEGGDPEGGDPEGGDPEGGDPEGGDPEGGDPEGGDPEGGDPEGGDPEGGDPEGGDPEGGDPEGGDPEGGDPEGGDPEGGDPDGGDPDGGDPDGGDPDGGDPDGGDPDGGDPDGGDPDGGDPGGGDPDGGDPDGGDPDGGDPDGGDPGGGDPDGGDPDGGDPGGGDPDGGDPDGGDVGGNTGGNDRVYVRIQGNTPVLEGGVVKYRISLWDPKHVIEKSGGSVRVQYELVDGTGLAKAIVGEDIEPGSGIVALTQHGGKYGKWIYFNTAINADVFSIENFRLKSKIISNNATFAFANRTEAYSRGEIWDYVPPTGGDPGGGDPGGGDPPPPPLPPPGVYFEEGHHEFNYNSWQRAFYQDWYSNNYERAEEISGYFRNPFGLSKQFTQWSEMLEGETARKVTVRLTHPSVEPITVILDVKDTRFETAVKVADKSLDGRRLTFLPGETAKDVFIKVTNDDVFEVPEIFRVELDRATDNVYVIEQKRNFIGAIFDSYVNLEVDGTTAETEIDPGAVVYLSNNLRS